MRAGNGFLTLGAILFSTSIFALGCGGGSSAPPPPPSTNPVPSITSLSPASVVVGSRSQTLTINGSGFIASSSVSFNGLAHTTTLASSGQLQITLSQAELASVGSFSVTVTNPQPGGGTSSGAQFQIAEGGLTVNIIDLPSGATGNVIVTGPNGVNTTLISSQTITGAAGAYVVTAAGVPYAASTYFANVPTQSVVVAIGDTVILTVDYYTIIPNTTKVLDQIGMQTLQVSPDGFTLTFSSGSTIASTLQPGDVLASAPTSSAPHGLLKRILSVSQNSGTLEVTTSQAALPDAISRAHFVFTQALGPSQLTLAAKGVRVRSANNSRMGSSKSAVQDSCSGNLTVLMTMYNVQLAADQNGNSITASGEAEECDNLDFEFDIGLFPPTVTKVKVVASGSEHVHIGVQGQYSTAFGLKNDVATFSTLVVGDIGGIPIVLEPSVTFYVGLNGNLNAGFSTGITQDARLQEGEQYQNGQWSTIESLTNNFGEDPLAIDASLDVKAYAGTEVDVTIDGILTPHLGADSYLKFYADINANPWWTLTGGFEGDVGCKIGIFGLSKDFDVPDIFQFSKVLLQASGGLSPAPTLLAL